MSSSEPRELYIQAFLLEGMSRHNIFPAEVICTFCLLPKSCGLVSVSMFHQSSTKLLLNYLDYEHMCDKSGILIEGNVIIFTGLGLVALLSSFNV